MDKAAWHEADRSFGCSAKGGLEQLQLIKP